MKNKKSEVRKEVRMLKEVIYVQLYLDYEIYDTKENAKTVRASLESLEG